MPVIIADEWVAPRGPAWADFSIRWPEAQIAELPDYLQSRADDFERDVGRGNGRLPIVVRTGHRAHPAVRPARATIAVATARRVSGQRVPRRSLATSGPIIGRCRRASTIVTAEAWPAFNRLSSASGRPITWPTNQLRPAEELRRGEWSLRIAMISYYLPSGSKIGVGYQADALATELTRRGHQVDVFSDCPPVDGASYGHRQIELRGYLRTFRFATQAQAGRSFRLRRAACPRRRLLDVAPSGPGACPDACMARVLARPCTFVDSSAGSHGRARILRNRGDAWSPTPRWSYRPPPADGHPWVRRVIPNGVDIDLFTPSPDGGRAENPTILFVGTWDGRKRGRDLAAAFVSAGLAAVPPDAQLWMVCQDAPARPAPLDPSAGTGRAGAARRALPASVDFLPAVDV